MVIKPHKITNYMKNVGKSFGYAVYDVFSEYNPTLKQITSTTAETSKELYESVREWRDQSKEVNADRLGIKGSIGAVFNNMKEDLASGNWYNKARQDSFDNAMMSGMMGGDSSFDFDFDDEDWGDDWGDDSSSSSLDDEWGEDDTAKAIVQDNHKTTKQIIASMDQVGYSVSGAINKGTATSANYVAEVSKAGTTALLNLNREGFSTIASALAGVNSNINNFAKIAQPLTVHMQNSMQFYTNTSQALDKMTKSLEDLVNNTAPKSAEKKFGNRPKGTFADIFDSDDIFDPGSYLEMVKDNFKNDKDLLDMAKNVIKSIDPRKFSPGVFLTKMMVGNMMKGMELSMKSLNETVKYFINDSLIKTRQRANSGTGIGGILMSFLGDYIFPKDSIKTNINTANYEKGKVDWDGKSRKALMEVIPSLLSMIHSDISGEEYLIYDYEQGKFKRKSSIAGDIREKRREASNAAAGDFRRDLHKAAREKFKDDNEKYEKIVEEIDAYFEEEFFRGSFDAIGITSFMKNKHYNTLRNRFKIHPDEIMDIFRSVARSYRKALEEGNYEVGTRGLRLTTDMVKARNRYSNNIRDIEAEGTSTYSALESLSETLQGNVKANSFRGSSIASLYSPDKYGNTMVDYIRGNYQYTKAIFELLSSGGGGGSRSRGSKSAKVTAPEALNMKEIKEKKRSTATNRAEKEKKLSGTYTEEDFDKAFDQVHKKSAKEIFGIARDKLDDYFVNNGFNAKSIMQLPIEAASGILTKISVGLSDIMWGKDGSLDNGLFGLFKEKATEAFDSFKDYFQNKFGQSMKDMFDKIFGAKDKDGKRSGGFLSDFYNETKYGLKNAASWTKETVSQAWYGKNYKKAKERLANEKKKAEEIAKEMQKYRELGMVDGDDNFVPYGAGSGSGLPLISLRRYRGGASAQRLSTGWRVVSEDGTEQFISEGRAKEIRDAYKNRGKSKAHVNAENFKDSIGGKGLTYIGDRIKDAFGIIFAKDPNKEKQKVAEAIDNATKEEFNLKDEMFKNKGAMGAGALIGGGVSLLTGGILGPLFGSALGAGVGLMVSSKAARERVFGEEEVDADGNPTGKIKGGVFGPATPIIHKLIVKQLPTGAKGAIVGAIPGLILGGQFGMFGGMVLGAGLNLWLKTDKNSDIFRDKVLDKLDELFRNTTNAIGGWIKKIGEEAKMKISSFIQKRIAKFLGSKIGQKVSGAAKWVGGKIKGAANKVGEKLIGVPGGLANWRKRRNAVKGYDVYDKKLGRNLTASEILESEDFAGVEKSSMGTFYQMISRAGSPEEIDEYMTAIDMVQNGRRYDKDNANILKSAQALAGRYGYTGDLENISRQIQNVDGMSEEDLKNYFDSFGLGGRFTESMMKNAKKYRHNAASRGKIAGIKEEYKKRFGADAAKALGRINISGARRYADAEKAALEEAKNKEAENENMGPEIPKVSEIEEHTGLIARLLNGIAKKLGAEHIDNKNSKIKEVITSNSSDPKNGSQEGHTSQDTLFGIHETITDKNGNMVEDKASASNKEYKENKSKFFKAMDSIPAFATITDKIGGFFNKLMGRLFGDDEEGKKKKSLFDYIKDIFLDDEDGSSIFGKFKKFFKGDSNSLFTKLESLGELAAIAGSVAAIVGIVGTISGKFNDWYKNHGFGGRGTNEEIASGKNENGDTTEIATDEKGNLITDEEGNFVGKDGSIIKGNIQYQNVRATSGTAALAFARAWAHGGTGLIGTTAHFAGNILENAGKRALRKNASSRFGNFAKNLGANTKKAVVSEAQWRKQLLYGTPKTVDDVVKTTTKSGAKEAVEEVGETAAKKTAKEIVDDLPGAVVKGANKTTSNVAKTGLKEVGEGAVEEAAEKAIKSEAMGELAEGLPRLFQKVANSKWGFLIPGPVRKSLAAVGSEVAEEAGEKIATTVSKEAANATAKGVEAGVRTTEQIPIAGWLIAIGMAVGDFAHGWTIAGRELGVKKATVVEKTISGLIETAIGLISVIPGVGAVWGTISTVVLSVVKPLLVKVITKAFQKRGFLQDLAKRQEELDKEYEAAESKRQQEAEAAGQKYEKRSKDQYIAQEYNQYTVGERIGNAFKSTVANVKAKGVGGALKSEGTNIKETATSIVNDIKDLLKRGDIVGFIKYTPKSDSSDTIGSAYIKAVALSAKINFAPAMIYTGIAAFLKKKAIDPIIGKAKETIAAAKQQLEYGNTLLQNPNSDLKDYFDVSGIKDDEGNPIGGLAKAAVIGARLTAIPVGIVKRVGKLMYEKISPIIEKAKSSWHTLVDSQGTILKSAWTGQWDQMWAVVQQGTDSEDNPLGPINKALAWTQCLVLSPLALITTGGRKIFEGVKGVIDKFKSAQNELADANLAILNLADKGSVKEILNYKLPEDPDNPMGSFTKFIFFVNKIGFTVTGGVHALGNFFNDKIVAPIKGFFDGIGESIDTEGQAMKELADGGKVTQLATYKIKTFNPISRFVLAVEQFAYLFSAIGNGVKGFFKNAGEDLYDAVASFIRGDEKTAVGGASKSFDDTSTAGGSSGFVSQLDPRYSGMNMGGTTFGAKGCGPAVASMVSGMPVSDSVSASSRYMTPQGVTADYFVDVLGSRGIRTRATTNKRDMLRSIAGSGNVILLGRDPYNTSKAYSPFGPNNHYVEATGTDGHGNLIINDPENPGPALYPASILNNVSMGIAAGGASGFTPIANTKNTSAITGFKSVEEYIPSKGTYYSPTYNTNSAAKKAVTSTASTSGNIRDRGYSSSMDSMYNSSGYGTASSVDDYRAENLGSWSTLSADQINSFIASKRPDSPFAGNGDIFVKAAEESGLDPRYILSHAALESGWGTSNIARNKNNYFGIGAFDSNPYNGAYSFNSGLAAGIIEGANWIARNYYHGKYGQTSIYKMRWNNNVHQYATDPGWDTKIANTMASMPANTKFKTDEGVLSEMTGSSGGTVGSSSSGSATSGSSGSSGSAASSSGSGKMSIGGVLGALSAAFGKIGEFLSGGLSSSDAEKSDNQEHQQSGTVATGNSAENGSFSKSNITNGIANNFPYYNQGDSRWGSHPYGSSGTISNSGCGPTSMAMVLRSYGKEYDPQDAADWSANHGYRVVGQGTGWGYFNAIGSQEGLSVQQFDNSDMASQSLDNNIPVIASMKPGTFTKSGHFIVLAGKDSEGRILVNDPNKQTGVWPSSTVFGEAKQYWAVEGPNGGSIGNWDKSKPTTSTRGTAYTAGYNGGNDVRQKVTTATRGTPYNYGAGSGLLTYSQLAAKAGGSSGVLMSARPGDMLYGRHMRATFNGPKLAPSMYAGGASNLLGLLNNTSSTSNASAILNSNADSNQQMVAILAKILEKVNLLQDITTNTSYIQSVREAVEKLAAGDLAGAQAAATSAMNAMNTQNNNTTEVDDSFRSLVGVLASVAKG